MEFRADAWTHQSRDTTSLASTCTCTLRANTPQSTPGYIAHTTQLWPRLCVSLQLKIPVLYSNMIFWNRGFEGQLCSFQDICRHSAPRRKRRTGQSRLQITNRDIRFLKLETFHIPKLWRLLSIPTGRTSLRQGETLENIASRWVPAAGWKTGRAGEF